MLYIKFRTEAGTISKFIPSLPLAALICMFCADPDKWGYLSADDYHNGEVLLPWFLYQKFDCIMYTDYIPSRGEKSPYHGAYLAVVESVCKLIATGASFEDVYLTFQEYFEKPGKDAKRWGKPLSALLGAFKAQMDLGIASIGGKDSMSGSFESLDVPPTLVSFAIHTPQRNPHLCS